MEIWKRNLVVCWFGTFATSLGIGQLAPILPAYINELGINSMEEVAHWSGLAYGITFIVMTIVAPIWGKAADRYGLKPMLIRAGLGMAIVMTAMAFVQNVEQLVALRFLQGLVAGYYAAAITLVASQTPPGRTGWALGTLSTGTTSGLLVGPLLGGYLVEIVGIRLVFVIIGGFLTIAFLLSLLFIKEEFKAAPKEAIKMKLRQVWKFLPHPQIVLTMFFATFVMHVSLVSMQPIITVYVTKLLPGASHIILIAGIAYAAPGLTTLLAAAKIGRLADKIGPEKVVLAAFVFTGVLFIPQAMVETPWQLIVLRFLMGLGTAGMLPAINSLLKKVTPAEVTGRIFGYSQSANFMGSFAGALAGGEIASRFGVESVFYCVGVFLLLTGLTLYKMGYSKPLNLNIPTQADTAKKN